MKSNNRINWKAFNKVNEKHCQFVWKKKVYNKCIIMPGIHYIKHVGKLTKLFENQLQNIQRQIEKEQCWENISDRKKEDDMHQKIWDIS